MNISRKNAFYLWIVISTLVVLVPLCFIQLPPLCRYAGEFGGEYYVDRDLFSEGGFFFLMSCIAFVNFTLVQYSIRRFGPKLHIIIKLPIYLLMMMVSAIIFWLRLLAVVSIYEPAGCSQMGGISMGGGFFVFVLFFELRFFLLFFGLLVGYMTIYTQAILSSNQDTILNS